MATVARSRVVCGGLFSKPYAGWISVWMRETLRCFASTSEIRSMWRY